MPPTLKQGIFSASCANKFLLNRNNYLKPYRWVSVTHWLKSRTVTSKWASSYSSYAIMFKLGVQSQVGSYQKLLKWYLIPLCLTLSIIKYVSRVKQSNPGNGIAPSPTPRCCSYWKRSLQVTFDYGRQLYLLAIWHQIEYDRFYTDLTHRLDPHRIEIELIQITWLVENAWAKVSLLLLWLTRYSQVTYILRGNETKGIHSQEVHTYNSLFFVSLGLKFTAEIVVNIFYHNK